MGASQRRPVTASQILKLNLGIELQPLVTKLRARWVGLVIEIGQPQFPRLRDGPAPFYDMAFEVGATAAKVRTGC